MSELLDLDDIAARWKVLREYARRHIVNLPAFPDPVPGSTRKTRRWRAADVEQFLSGSESEPVNIPKNRPNHANSPAA